VTLALLSSLRTKILLAVILCAVAPLAAVGLWLTSMAPRSGERLLRSQLDSVVDRTASTVRDRWRHRRSDALLLAGNVPIRSALRVDREGADLPEFVRRAYETMPGIAGMIVTDAKGRTRWTLGQAPARAVSSRLDERGGTPVTDLVLSVPVRDKETLLGEVIVAVHPDGLLPPALSGSSGETTSQFIAMYDRSQDAWHRPLTLPAELLASPLFTWEGQRWITSRRSLDSPPVDIVAGAALDPFVQPFLRTAKVGAVALTLVAVLVVVVTMIVTGRLTASLAQLAGAADNIARGDLDALVTVRSRDEVGRVARTFNEMTASIRRMMTELSQREAVAAMGELAATLAHQVRSPVTAIRLDVERSLTKLPPDAPERALLGRALEQIDRLERAVDGSLKVARSTGIEFVVVDLREPLSRAVAGVALEHLSRHVSFDMEKANNATLVVRGDPASLEQLFTNLLMNAAQASSRGQVVSVSAIGSATGRHRIIIKDAGTGMDATTLAHAGEPFFSARAGGTGLGLAIAKRIVAAHGGVLSIESLSGAGTTVSVDFPGAVPL